jgi:hypothetical protein
MWNNSVLEVVYHKKSLDALITQLLQSFAPRLVRQVDSREVLALADLFSS